MKKIILLGIIFNNFADLRKYFNFLSLHKERCLILSDLKHFFCNTRNIINRAHLTGLTLREILFLGRCLILDYQEFFIYLEIIIIFDKEDLISLTIL